MRTQPFNARTYVTHKCVEPTDTRRPASLKDERDPRLAPLTSVGQPGSSAGNQPCEGVATLPSSKRGTTNQDRPGRVISEVIELEEASIIPGWGHPNELKHPSKRAHCLVPRHGHTLRFDNPHQTHRLSHPKLAVPLLCSGSSVPACAKIDPD
jgi:hypothetical protein